MSLLRVLICISFSMSYAFLDVCPSFIINPNTPKSNEP